MAIRRLNGDAVGSPAFAPGADEAADVFEFSSHARAREALDFGLSITDSGFNIFVLGEDRSGRMTATVAYLRAVTADRPRPNDWVYLNNFRRPHRPRPYRLPAGVGRAFRDRMAALVSRLRETLQPALSDEANEDRVRAGTEKLTEQVTNEVDAITAEANVQGLDIARTAAGRGDRAAPEGGGFAAGRQESRRIGGDRKGHRRPARGTQPVGRASAGRHRRARPGGNAGHRAYRGLHAARGGCRRVRGLSGRPPVARRTPAGHCRRARALCAEGSPGGAALGRRRPGAAVLRQPVRRSRRRFRRQRGRRSQSHLPEPVRTDGIPSGRRGVRDGLHPPAGRRAPSGERRHSGAARGGAGGREHILVPSSKAH